MGKRINNATRIKVMLPNSSSDAAPCRVVSLLLGKKEQKGKMLLEEDVGQESHHLYLCYPPTPPAPTCQALSMRPPNAVASIPFMPKGFTVLMSSL